MNIYDCIEFNDRLRFIDVANDLAFLAMDFDYAGATAMEADFMEKMIARLRDSDLARVFDFYKCYRAFVRGKVNSIRAADPECPKNDVDKATESARRHFRLALRYAVRGSRPLLLAVIGRIASGKSTFSGALAKELDCAVLSSDRVRKGLAGVALHERPSALTRSSLYSPEMTRKTYTRLFDLAEAEIRNGRDVILDATFSQRSWRDEFRSRFAFCPAQLRFIELQAGDDQIKKRLSARETQIAELSDARLEDFEKLAGSYEQPVELKPNELSRIRTSESDKQTCGEGLISLAQLNVLSQGHESIAAAI